MSDDQLMLRRQVCDQIRRHHPTFTGRASEFGDGCDGGPKLTVLGRMEPCERCGTPIVPFERESGHRNWWALKDARREGKGWRVRWSQHTASRCASAREELAS